MSLSIIATLCCDTCGAILVSKPETRSTRGMVAFYNVKIAAKKAGWLTISRGRYYVPAHYCPECADKPMKPIKRVKEQP